MFGTVALAGTLLLAACGGDSGDDDAAIASPSVASPTVTVEATPTVDLASIEAVPIATAFENLLAQESYRMTLTVNGLPGMEELALLFGDQVVMEVEQAGDDRHISVGGETGAALLEVWSVGGEAWVDIGTGPTPLEDSLLAGQGIEEVLTAPDQILAGMTSDESPEIDWKVTALEEMNGVETIVQEATFTTEEEASGPGGMLAAPSGATVDATMWVAEDDMYLVRMEAEAAAEIEDLTASPDTSTPDADAGEPSVMTIVIEVEDVGEIDEIEVPSATPMT